MKTKNINSSNLSPLKAYLKLIYKLALVLATVACLVGDVNGTLP